MRQHICLSGEIVEYESKLKLKSKLKLIGNKIYAIDALHNVISTMLLVGLFRSGSRCMSYNSNTSAITEAISRNEG